jgi:CBS domain-containing protein
MLQRPRIARVASNAAPRPHGVGGIVSGVQTEGGRMTRAPDTIGELMKTDVVVVGPDTTVRDALRAMIDRDIGSVVIVDDGRAVGIFTERDVTRHILSDASLLDERVADLMSQPPVTVGPDAQVVDVFELMNARSIRRLPVVDGDRLVGIVTEGDLRRWVGLVAKE